MGARRSHTKSRNGCSQCKSRRIKCDELPPQCSNCARRQIECDFSRQTPSGSAPFASPALSSASHPVPSFGSPADSTPLTTATGLNLKDLELLHHYTTVTYKTLPSGSAPDQHELWQVHIVQLGFQHEFLIRGILAVSALHLLYLRPNRQEALALRASAHQSIALQQFQETLNRVDTSNCTALFAFSCIIVALAFATPRSPESGGFEDIFDWFHMIRGCNSVVQSQWETIAQSFLAPLLKKGMVHETAASHNVRDCDRVTELLRLCVGEKPGQGWDGSNACALAVHELLNTYTQVSILMDRKQDFVPVIYVWPISIPQTYLALLRDRSPEALVILAYYSALLQRVDDQWYMRGWARYLVTQIDAALGEKWQDWLAWPKEVTGLPGSKT